MCLRVNYMKKIWKNPFFFLSLSHWRKESVSELDADLDPVRGTYGSVDSDQHQNVTDPPTLLFTYMCACVRVHVKTVHEGRSFPCHLCDHVASYKNNLKRHILSIHSCWTHSSLSTLGVFNFQSLMVLIDICKKLLYTFCKIFEIIPFF
jgi:hypothetical protein